MSNFTDLLNRPLPSKVKEEVVTESENEVVLQVEPLNPVGAGEDPEPVPTTGVEPSYAPAPEVSETDPAEAAPEEEPAEELTPEESRRVDDVINTVATPMLLQSELNEEEIKEFTESVDGSIAENEGFLTERTVVRFDKNARKAQLYEVAVFAVAREKKDRDYRKLETCWRIERRLKAKLKKKYHSQAMMKVKEYLKRAKGSKSGILARIASKLHKAS